MGTATTGTELFVTTNDEVGALAKCSVTLRENNINIDAVCAYGMEGKASFMLVTTDNAKAKTLLTGTGYTVEENNVVCWTAGNTPGTLNKGTAALAEKGINIKYMYGTACNGTATTWVVLNTTNNTEAATTLGAI